LQCYTEDMFRRSKQPGEKVEALLRRARTHGEIAVPMSKAEFLTRNDPESFALVDLWPASRIKDLPKLLKLPVARIVALLGIGKAAFYRLGMGDFTPSAALCRRMQQLQDMGERGDLHHEVVPSTHEMRRRMTMFRWWFFNRPATAELPLVTLRLRVWWGKHYRDSVEIQVKHLPALRLQKWEGLVEVVKTFTVTARRLAQANARLMWKQSEQEFWEHYSRDTLPKIVLEKAAKQKARRRVLKKAGA